MNCDGCVHDGVALGYRVKLRRFFEVNRYYVAVAALKALADDGEIKPEKVDEAIKKYGLDTERPDPWTV